MRIIDADTIQWTANGCGHPNCKDICDYTKDDGTCCGWLVAHKRDVDSLPTVDAVPVVHGHWIRKSDYIGVKYECSVCGHKDSKTTAIRGHYCWFCGAIMDGEHGN